MLIIIANSLFVINCSPPPHFHVFVAGTSECGTERASLAYASSVTVFVGRDAVVLLRGFDVNEFGVMKHVRPGEMLTYQNFL